MGEAHTGFTTVPLPLRQAPCCPLNSSPESPKGLEVPALCVAINGLMVSGLD